MANNGVTEEGPVENFPSAKGLSAGDIHPEDDIEEENTRPWVEVEDGPSWEEDFWGWRQANGIDE
jgi:hypothetical protein